MPTPDLPIELWLEILRYLPRSALRKMIGINRVLFELALDEKYFEIRFMADDKDTEKMFAQLSFPNIAMRAQHLYIRPTFLPVMDGIDELMPDSQDSTGKGATILMTIKNSVRRAASICAAKADTSDPSFRILKAASSAVKSCPSLRDISLVVHDHTLTPSFMRFLDSLWTADTIGTSLRNLIIDSTVSKLPLLLERLTKRSKSFPNLAAFDLNISISRIPQSHVEWKAASAAVEGFLWAFSRSLTSFAFSSMIDCDINELFDSFPKLTKLTTFEFRAVFNVDTFPYTGYFTQFIRRHRQTLTALVIKPRARSATISISDDSYSFWLNRPPATETLDGVSTFSQLVFPRLKTLEVGLREPRGIDDRFLLGQSSGSVLYNFIPDFSRISPNLTKLVLPDKKLTSDRMMALLDMLAVQNGGSLLEEFEFSTIVLLPMLFDRLSQVMPRLRSLTIQCNGFSAAMQFLDTRLGVNEPVEFERAMRARFYPGWSLRYLRIGTVYHCGVPHPNEAIMQSIAQSLLRDVVLDTELRCDCVENVNYYLPLTRLVSRQVGRYGLAYDQAR